MSIMSPALALGQTVHEVVESLSSVPVEDRFSTPLVDMYNVAWKKVSGEKGGFKNQVQEEEFKTKGQAMIERIVKNPGPVGRKAVKIRQELPYYWLSDEENIILCGKIDWLEYLPDTNSVSILDFKTGKYDEDPDSLQLPIYLLLASNCQARKVNGASYWYLERDDAPKDVELPEVDTASTKVLNIAKKIALVRKLNHFQCPQIDGCRNCRDLELAVSGKAKYVGQNDFGQELYVVLPA